jgi:ATP adenylyltransferase
MISTLWAPWRMTYIAGARRESGCLLCALPRETADRDSLILHRGRTVYVVLNRYPYNNGHLMVVPYRHCAELAEFTAEESLELMGAVQRTTDAIREAFRADGFNVGFNLGKAAGAGIADHVHLHVVPRWVGDTNFMPVLADTRVMPDHLAATYDKLMPFFGGPPEQGMPCSSR